MGITQFDKTQLTIAKYSQAVVEYFQSLIDEYVKRDEAEKHIPCIGDAFDIKTMNGRLFFDPNVVPVPPMLKTLFAEPLVTNAFATRYAIWQFVSDEQVILENIASVREQFIEYFFRPIESTDVWEAFWSHQCRAIIKLHELAIKKYETALTRKEEMEKNTETTAAAMRAIEEEIQKLYLKVTSYVFEAEKQQLRDRIAGAFVYKLSALWASTATEDPQVYKNKLDVFGKLVSAIGNTGLAMQGQVSKAERLIENSLASLKSGLLAGEYKQSDGKGIFKQLKSTIEEIVRHDQFSLLDNKEQALIRYLLSLCNDYYKCTHKNYYISKKISEAVMEYINGIYTNFLKEDKLPNFINSAIKTLYMYIGREVRERCKKMLSCYKATLQHEEAISITLVSPPSSPGRSGMFARSGSPLPFVSSSSQQVVGSSSDSPKPRPRSKSFTTVISKTAIDSPRSTTPSNRRNTKHPK